MEAFSELKWYKQALYNLLKPCPFCGKKDIAIHAPNQDNQEDITCLNCGVKLTKALGVGVVQAWNERK